MNESNRVIESEDLSDSMGNAIKMEEIGPDNLLNMEVGVDMEEHGSCQGRVKKRAIMPGDDFTNPKWTNAKLKLWMNHWRSVCTKPSCISDAGSSDIWFLECSGVVF